MSPGHQRSLEAEQTQGALRALEIAPTAEQVANEEAIGRPAPLTHPEEDVHGPAKGIASGLAVGAALWAAVASLVWLNLR
jgi:hypothetical protein